MNHSGHTQEIVETLAYFHTQASILSASCRSGTSENASESQVLNNQEGLAAHPSGTSDRPCSVFQARDDIEETDKENDEDEN